MSMDNTVSPSAAKVAQRGSGHGAAKPQDATPGDFAALLIGLGADELALPPTEAAIAVPAEAGEIGADPAAVPLDPALLMAGQPPAAEPVVPNPVAEGVAATAAPAAGTVPTLPLTAAERATQALELRAGIQTAPGDAAATNGPAPAKDEVQPLLHQALLAQRMAQHRSQAAEAVQAARQTQGETLAARLGWQISEPAAQAPGALLAAAGEALPTLTALERRSERGAQRLGEAPGWSAVPQPEGARLDVPAVAPDGGLTTEMRVAEQVSYWIGRGTQNAELEVEGLGEGPVKVSIELQGQEARVEFRADQAQTRQILQESMPHLRELLERDGLVLSGLSVGTSGSERGQGQGPGAEGRPGQRPGQAALPELPAAALAAAHRAAPLSGRSVDLFV